MEACMRTPIYVVLRVALVSAACAKEAEKAPDTAKVTPAGAPAAAPAPAAIALKDVAGTGNLTAPPAPGPDTPATLSVITATADTAGWSMTFNGKKPVALHVRTDGDSIMLSSEKYSSARRKGVNVVTTSVY